MEDLLKFLNDAHLWMLIGTLILVFSVFLTACIYHKRKKFVARATEHKERDAEKAIEEKCTSDELQLSTSIDIPYRTPSTSPLPRLKRFQHSLSLDAEFPVHVRRCSVQPASYYRRSDSMCYQRLSPTTIGSLQPDLYKSSESDNCSNSHTDVGQICFTLYYKKESSLLQVTLLRAKYLPGRGLSKTNRDPFVKVYLLPDEENCQQSKVKKKTLSPKFNETFLFNVPEEELSSRCLRFSVYDLDKRKVRHCLGHAIVSLAKTDFLTDGAIWRNLEKSLEPQQEGVLQVSLMCNPYNHRLKVVICKVKNVEGMDSGGAYLYTRVQLFHGHKLLKTRKTSSQTVVGPSKSEFMFHESFTFTVPARFYESCFLLLTTVISGGATVSDAPHGKLTIGPFLFARGERLLHWQEMVTNPRNLVTRWHKLETAKLSYTH